MQAACWVPYSASYGTPWHLLLRPAQPPARSRTLQTVTTSGCRGVLGPWPHAGGRRQRGAQPVRLPAAHHLLGQQVGRRPVPCPISFRYPVPCTAYPVIGATHVPYSIAIALRHPYAWRSSITSVPAACVGPDPSPVLRALTPPLLPHAPSSRSSFHNAAMPSLKVTPCLSHACPQGAGVCVQRRATVCHHDADRGGPLPGLQPAGGLRVRQGRQAGEHSPVHHGRPLPPVHRGRRHPLVRGGGSPAGDIPWLHTVRLLVPVLWQGAWDLQLWVSGITGVSASDDTLAGCRLSVPYVCSGVLPPLQWQVPRSPLCNSLRDLRKPRPSLPALVNLPFPLPPLLLPTHHRTTPRPCRRAPRWACWSPTRP